MKKTSFKPGNMLYPLPVVMVSCKREGEKPNIITVAWAGTVCSTPAMLSISVRRERYSYDILKETGEFVVNLVNKDLVYATDYCGVKSGRDTDKYKDLKLTELASTKIKAPGIAESPVNLECKVVSVKHLGSHDMFLAEIVHVTVDEAYMDKKGTFHLNDSQLVTYSHGKYFELGKELGTFGYSVKKKTDRKRQNDNKSNGKRYSGNKSDGKQYDVSQRDRKYDGKKKTEGKEGSGYKEKNDFGAAFKNSKSSFHTYKQKSHSGGRKS